MLTRNHRQEGLCRAYVHAVASCCGMSWSTPSPDYGVDVTLIEIDMLADRRSESGVKVDVQLRSTTRAALGLESVVYELDVRTYDFLRRPAPLIPRILVVLLLPPDEADWTHQTENELTLRRCAYWISLEGSQASKNRKSVRVVIPRANLFSAAALLGLVRRIKTGGER